MWIRAFDRLPGPVPGPGRAVKIGNSCWRQYGSARFTRLTSGYGKENNNEGAAEEGGEDGREGCESSVESAEAFWRHHRCAQRQYAGADVQAECGEVRKGSEGLSGVHAGEGAGADAGRDVC